MCEISYFFENGSDTYWFFASPRLQCFLRFHHQVRTLLWTEFYLTPDDKGRWATSEFRPRLMEALMKLKEMVAGRMLVSHFFIPDVDIMAEVPKREREFLYIMFFIVREIF